MQNLAAIKFGMLKSFGFLGTCDCLLTITTDLDPKSLSSISNLTEVEILFY